jgi:hypothetical protein
MVLHCLAVQCGRSVRVMAVLSVDLATRRWSDLGIVLLDRKRQEPEADPTRFGQAIPARPLLSSLAVPDDVAECPITCEIFPWNDPGPVDADTLAGRLNHLCGVRQVSILLLDGPQAWKSGHNGLEHARVSERQLNTPAKTGLPGMVKPLTYRPFAEFCLDVYDALCQRGWRRLDTLGQPGSPLERVLVESYPYAAWKSLGLKPLPSKRRAKVSDLAEAFSALRSLIPLTVNRPPNHDQLQAIVAGLAGLALEDRNTAGAHIVGNPPRREDGYWREGFIVLPLPPQRPTGFRWLH